MVRLLPHNISRWFYYSVEEGDPDRILMRDLDVGKGKVFDETFPGMPKNHFKWRRGDPDSI